jgi:bifunctional non-homologous end joining protein LigD
MPRALDEYRHKRDFKKTAEPSGETAPHGAETGALRFVIQKHAATALHFDLRLEEGGVMKSWAVPKGPSFDPAVKRLAMQVEDHPIAYNDFEGTIPKGEYGGGTVMIWDLGTYTEDEAGPEGDEAAVREGLKSGKLSVTFHGKRMRGSFALVRIKRGSPDKPQWLLIKHRDKYADPTYDPVATALTSAVTGRTMDEIARADKPRPASAVAIQPMLATVGEHLPTAGSWTFEPKYDGIRVIAYATPTSVALMTRNGKDKAAQFPEVSDALRDLAKRRRGPLVLDGEIVALIHGSPGRFQALQDRIHLQDPTAIKTLEHKDPSALIVFDLLVDGDTILTDEPWTERRARLERRLGHATTGALRLGDTEPDGKAMLDRARAEGWEGVMAKRTDALYRPGVRTPAWQKLKIEHRQEFVVGGYTDPRKSRVALGALLVGYYKNNELLYAGHVGGGFTTEGLREMHDTLEKLERKTSPFTTTPDTNEPAHWVKPQIVVEVKFNEWTGDGRLRQPIFVGVRDDKDPKTVTREKSSTIGIKNEEERGEKEKGEKEKGTEKEEEDKDANRKSDPPKKRARSASSKDPVVAALKAIEQGKGDGTVPIGTAKLDVTNLKKVFFPDSGYTKGDVLRYYATVAKAIVPTTTDRPLVLKRFPNGIGGKAFFQQNAGDVPEGVRVETIEEKDEKVRRFVGGSLVTLLYTVQLGAISVDPWHSRVQSLDTPDYTIIDLDPGDDATFKRVVTVARYVKETLDALGLHGAVKTSGASGIHIYLPLPPHTPAEAATLLAQLVATRVASSHPKEATVTRAVKARATTSVYVDYLQNIVGKTVAGPYCVRAVPGAHVSTPLDWSELTDDLDPAAFTIETVPPRLAERGDLWAAAMRKRNTAAVLRSLR